MSQYNEPWTSEQCRCGCCAIVWNAPGKEVCCDVDTETAARIVAAVNACAGMQDPEKEIAELKEMRKKLTVLADFGGKA